MKYLKILAFSLIFFLTTVAASSAPMPSVALAVPAPTSPANGTLFIYFPGGPTPPPSLTPVPITLSWSNTSADHYEVWVSTEPGFYTTPVEDDTNVTSTSQLITSTLTPATTYYWRVRAFDASNNPSGWSGTATFRTSVLPPTLSIPNDGATLENNRPIFQWSSVANATGYNLQVSQSSLFSSTLINVSVSYTTTQYQPATALPSNVTLYWRVRTLSNSYGPSDWSQGPVGKFFTIASTALQPTTPVLVQPASGKLTTDTTPRLVWKAVTIPSATNFSYYQIQISTSNTLVTDNSPDASGFSHTGELTSPIIDDNSVTTQVLDPATGTAYFDVPDPSEALPAGKTFYWHVRAVNTYNSNTYYSDWSSVFTLLTAYDPVALNTPADGAQLLNNRPQFSWTDPNPLPHSGYYRIQISTTPTFGSLIVDTLASNPWTPGRPLPANKTLYWRVRIEASPYAPTLWGSAGSLGNFFSLTTANPPSVPVLNSPASNALVTTYTPTFRWSISSLPLGTTFDHYQIQVSTGTALNPDGSFVTTVIDDGSATNQYDPEFTPGSSFNPSTRYYWHVMACNSTNQCSNWSPMWTFRSPIDAPTLNTYSGNSLTIPFTWSAVPLASGYQIQIARTSNFSNIAINTNTTTVQFVGGGGLPNGTYYWRVRALNPVFGPGIWSASDFFTKP